MSDEPKPDDLSADMAAMAPYCRMVTSILGGVKTMRMAGTDYLPKFPAESDTAYAYRSSVTKFTNVFRDITENLAQRPFSKPVQIKEDGAGPLVEFADNVDGQGNNLHVFAGELFFSGINYSISWVLVEHTKALDERASKKDEKQAGARPYWVHYQAKDVIAVHSAMVGGSEEFVHVRLSEPKVVRDGFGEKVVNRVRVLNREETAPGVYGPATYQVLQEPDEDDDGDDAAWTVVEEGPITIGVIALVPFLAGRREGRSWVTNPPMRDAAELQIDVYQQESALKYAKEMTAFPMLAGNGVTPPTDAAGNVVSVPVGPHRVLYAPEGSWTFVEPSATSLTFMATDIRDTIAQLRELGRQPLTAQSGNLTVVTTAVAADKGNAAIQAWALNLKDALERCLIFTALWLNLPALSPSVMINTEFDLSWRSDDTFEHVLAMRANGEISREATIHEAKRRQVLDPEYDPDADLDLILGDIESDDGDDEEPGADDRAKLGQVEETTGRKGLEGPKEKDDLNDETQNG